MSESLHELIKGDNKQAIAKLLSGRKAPNVNAVDSAGRTPLHTAASLGKTDIVSLLLEHGADPNIRDKTSWTPIYCALSNRYLHTADRLLDGGAYPILTNDGTSPVHYLARTKLKDTDTMEIKLFKTLLDKLIRAGNSVNATNAAGETPLHHAAMKGSVVGVQILVSYGASLGLKTVHQQSILHYAVQAARNEVVAYLLETHKFPKEDIAVCLEIAIAMADVQMQNMLQNALGAASTSSQLSASTSFLRTFRQEERASEQTICETLYKMDNLLLEVHRLRFGVRLSDDEIKGYARKREQLEESILSLTAQKAELQSKVAELELGMEPEIVARELLHWKIYLSVQRLLDGLHQAANALRENVAAVEDNLKRLVPNAAQLKAKDLSSSDKTASQSGIPPGSMSDASGGVSAQAPLARDLAVVTSQIESMQALVSKLEEATNTKATLETHNRFMSEQIAALTKEVSQLQAQCQAMEAQRQELSNQTAEASAYIDQLTRINDSITHLNTLIQRHEVLDPSTNQLSSAAQKVLEECDLTGLLDKVNKGSRLYHLAAENSLEEDTDEIKLVKKEGDIRSTVRAGTIPKLIERLTYEKYPDFAFQKAFLLTYRSFMSPTELMEKLIFRYCVTPNMPKIDMSMKNERQIPIRLRVLNVMKYWLENHFSDFSDENLCQIFIDFLDNTVAQTSNPKLAQQLKSIVQRKLEGKEATAKNISFARGDVPESIIPVIIPPAKLTLMDIADVELARQLALLHSEYFRQIAPQELLKCAWIKEDKQVRAPNVLNAIRNFNRTSSWAATELLRREDLQARRAVLRKLIMISKESYKMNNFDTVMAIVAALESSAVHRLKKTWAEMDKEVQDAYNMLNEFSSINISKLREKLHLVEPPCVPYLGIYLTELVYIEETPDRIEGGLINFAKMRKVAEIILEIQQYQIGLYPFRIVPEIRDYLANFECLDEATLYNISHRVEPKAVQNS